MRILLHVRIWLAFVFICIVPNVAPAQQLPPYSYYATTSNTTSTTLKSALHDIIKGHTVISYTPTHDALVVLDQDPTNSANVILIYSGFSVAASTWPSWNREHIWPESFGTSSGTQHSDLFNLRACDQGVNSSRGNKYYDVSTGTIGHYSGAPQSSYDSDSWEPWDPNKGYVARACLYMATRYDGTGGDAYFQLAEWPNAGALVFAKLSTMLDWNRRFPPTDYERNRNGVIYQTYQHNRNPFIDNPDFADMVFLGVDGFTAWQGTHFPQAELTNATVSGAAADPDGDGMPNLAEYAFGHDPHVAEAGAIQSPTMQTDGGTNYLYVTHHRNHYASGITITYEASTDLTSWAEVTPETVSATQIDAQKDLVTVRFVASGPSEFVRLRIHRLADGPDIVPEGAMMVSEGCAPANGVLDPGETVTVNFSLQNVGSENTSNLVATLLATGGVTSPSGAQNYGAVVAGGAAVAQPFTFTTTGACGGSVAATLQLQDGPANLGSVTYVFLLGQAATPLAENFDGVTPPSLPGDWTTSASGAQSNWVTSTTQSDTPPNAAFSPDPGGVGVNELDTPSFFIGSASVQLTFQQNYNLPASTTNSSLGYDGGVLEIKIGSGSFQDILDAGGSFVSGGYNTMLSGDYTNPLAGRQAWSGNSGGFLTTTVNLPAAAAGQNVQLRWRCGAGSTPPLLGSSGTLAFWSFDGSGTVTNADLTASGISAAPISVSNVSGSLTNYQGNPSSGKAIAASGFTTASGPPTGSYSYFSFAITVTSGFEASLSSVSFDDRASGTGPTLFDVQVSQQSNFSSIMYDSGAHSTHGSFSTTPMNVLTMTNSNLTGPIYFRIYAYGASASAGTWRLDNLNIQGDVAPVEGGGGGGWYVDSVSIEDTICCGTSGP